jgi:hypothetical protein
MHYRFLASTIHGTQSIPVILPKNIFEDAAL